MPFLYLKSRLTRSASGLVLTLLLAVLAWFFCLYAGLEARKAEEREDAWDIPVELVITDLRGTKSDQLHVYGSALWAFMDAESETDQFFTVPRVDLPAWFSQIRVKSTLYFKIRQPGAPADFRELVGITSLDTVQDFDPRLGTAKAEFFDGASTEFYEAHGTALIIPETYLELTREGEDGRLYLPVTVSTTLNGSGTTFSWEAEVTGVYTGSDSTAIYCAWPLAAKLMEQAGIDAFADSISATVADARRLDELGELLKYYFTDPDPAGAPVENPHDYLHINYAFASVIHDETLQETLKSFDRSIATLKRLRPLLLILEMSVAASAAFFSVHMRKRELSVARSLGTPQTAVVLTLLEETLIFSVIASAVAVGASLAVPLCVLSPFYMAAIDLAALAGTAAGGLKVTGRSGILSLKEET